MLGDAAGHAHPLTGEGIAHALWPAELLAEAFAAGDPTDSDKLWRKYYGQTLLACGEMLNCTSATPGAYELLLHLALALAFPAQG